MGWPRKKIINYSIIIIFLRLYLQYLIANFNINTESNPITEVNVMFGGGGGCLVKMG